MDAPVLFLGNVFREEWSVRFTATSAAVRGYAGTRRGTWAGHGRASVPAHTRGAGDSVVN